MTLGEGHEAVLEMDPDDQTARHGRRPHMLSREVRGANGADMSNGTAQLRKTQALPKKVRFIEGMAIYKGNVSRACIHAGWTNRATAYHHRDIDPEFKRAWDEAIEVSLDMLEGAAEDRAYGWWEPVYDKEGNRTGDRWVYSDKMLELLLRGRLRQKYGDKVEHDVNHKGGVLLIPRPLSEEEWEKFADAQQKAHRDPPPLPEK